MGSGATRRRWRHRAPPGRRRRPGRSVRARGRAAASRRGERLGWSGLNGRPLSSLPLSLSPSLSLFLPARPGVAGSWTLGAVWGCGSRPGARAVRRGGPVPSRPPGRAAAPALSLAPGSAAALSPLAPGCGFALPAAISANPALRSGNVGLCAVTGAKRVLSRGVCCWNASL